MFFPPLESEFVPDFSSESPWIMGNALITQLFLMPLYNYQTNVHYKLHLFLLYNSGRKCVWAGVCVLLLLLLVWLYWNNRACLHYSLSLWTPPSQKLTRCNQMTACKLCSPSEAANRNRRPPLRPHFQKHGFSRDPSVTLCCHSFRAAWRVARRPPIILFVGEDGK